MSWLITADIDNIPERLRPAALEVRQALADGKLRNIEFWFTHNLPESENVRLELEQVARGAVAAIKAEFPKADKPEVKGIEVGIGRLNEWYKSLTVPIIVSDELTFVSQGATSLRGDGWKAIVASVPAGWLYRVFSEYGTNLFSANVRHYLGSRKSTSNINHGIKNTATNEPNRFWVYNNGITALCNDASFTQSTDGTHIKLKGLSIVNGAQTTGAIGQLQHEPKDMWIPARFVVCNDQSIVQNIIRYNNSQNPIKPTDFRSTDHIQRQLVKEFEDIPGCSYNGGRRGGAGDAIKRPGNALPAETVAQVLAALRGDPGVAYHQKSEIWESNNLYSRYFGETVTARHILFCYSLHEKIREKRTQLRKKDSSRRDSEQRNLDFLSTRGASLLLMAAIGKSLDTIIDRTVPSVQSLSFTSGTSLTEACDNWTEVLDSIVSLSTDLEPALREGLRKEQAVSRGITAFVERVESLKIPLQPVFSRFAARVDINTKPS